jgi:hypothetical protein
MTHGFDDADRPLEPAIEALELLAGVAVSLGTRCQAVIGTLVQPVHHTGRLFSWEIIGTN